MTIPPAVPPLAYSLGLLRGNGWRVTIHNNYEKDSECYSFWLFTHNKSGRFIKREGPTDTEAQMLYDCCILVQQVDKLRDAVKAWIEQPSIINTETLRQVAADYYGLPYKATV